MHLIHVIAKVCFERIIRKVGAYLLGCVYIKSTRDATNQINLKILILTKLFASSVLPVKAL